MKNNKVVLILTIIFIITLANTSYGEEVLMIGGETNYPPYPGNVRELENLIEMLVALSDGYNKDLRPF